MSKRIVMYIASDLLMSAALYMALNYLIMIPWLLAHSTTVKSDVALVSGDFHDNTTINFYISVIVCLSLILRDWGNEFGRRA